jgi:Flp pilus assembly protein CpaB
VAAIVIVVFLNQYRDNVKNGGVPTTVLVAGKLIEKGASGETIGAEGLFKPSELPRDQVKSGALTDASTLRGKVAVADILPGAQLTAADFKAAGSGIITKLAADQRAITLSLDNAHGMVGSVRTGDHVDVIVGFMVDNALGRQRPLTRTLMQNVLVLNAPTESASRGGLASGGGNQAKPVTLRISRQDAPKLAFAADNGKVWLALRPQNGEPVESPSPITVESLLFGSKPVRSGR